MGKRDWLHPYKPSWRMKSFMRIPSARAHIRQVMMDRLNNEVRAKEVKELLEKQQFGVTKQRKPRTKKG